VAGGGASMECGVKRRFKTGKCELLEAFAFILTPTSRQSKTASGDASTNLTGYSHGFILGATPDGVTFGRYGLVSCERLRPGTAYGEAISARRKVGRFVGRGRPKKAPSPPMVGRFGSVAHWVRLEEDWRRTGISPAR